MQRVQEIKLLSAFALTILVGCQEKNTTVSEYLHDMDYTKQQLAIYRNDLGKYENDPNYRNAVEADLLTQTTVLRCWPKKPSPRVTTANTNHQCLDDAGYKR